MSLRYGPDARKEQHFQKSVSKSHALISLTLFSYSTTIILFKKTYFGPSNDKNIFILPDFWFQNFAFRTWRRKFFCKLRRLLAYQSVQFFFSWLSDQLSFIKSPFRSLNWSKSYTLTSLKIWCHCVPDLTEKIKSTFFHSNGLTTELKKIHIILVCWCIYKALHLGC